MILSVRINNYLVYSNEVELSLCADMHTKKFANNIYNKNRFNVLKSLCIYGANNSGKTCIIRAINSIKNVLLNIVAEVPTNIFNNSKTCSLGLTFLENNKTYSYDFKYNSDTLNGYKKGFVFESFKELLIDKYGNLSEKIIYIRDFENNRFIFDGNKELENILSIVSPDNILIYTINPSKYSVIEQYRDILRKFASKIDIIDMNNIPIEKTINVLKNDEVIKEKTVELIKLADLDINDYTYLKTDNLQPNDTNQDPRENVLKNSVLIDDIFRLTSYHRGKPVQSLTFDSTGTKKIVAVASYIIDAITNGKTLVVDELDSSLHFKLTRAIVALFNNENNKDAQLIFTAHDITLLDCKRLFRKDQIWFTSKDNNGEYVYSLADFNSRDDKIRSESDLFNKYNDGVFGAIPEPDLIFLFNNLKH